MLHVESDGNCKRTYSLCHVSTTVDPTSDSMIADPTTNLKPDYQLWNTILKPQH